MTTRAKALKLLGKAADHIETHGLLFNEWVAPTASGGSCCCLIGTIRLVAGFWPDEGIASAEVEEAIDIVNQATWTERQKLGAAKGHDMPDELTQWSDHYADREEIDDRLAVNPDGDRAPVVKLLRALVEGGGRMTTRVEA